MRPACPRFVASFQKRSCKTTARTERLPDNPNTTPATGKNASSTCIVRRRVGTLPYARKTGLVGHLPSPEGDPRPNGRQRPPNSSRRTGTTPADGAPQWGVASCSVPGRSKWSALSIPKSSAPRTTYDLQSSGQTKSVKRRPFAAFFIQRIPHLFGKRETRASGLP